jgi:protein associated with RNAse G/E
MSRDQPLAAAHLNEVTVRVLKHDGVEHRRWRGQIAEEEGSLIVLDAEFDVDVSHQLLGEIRRGTRLIEYYWLDRWYNVFRFLQDDGSTRLYYCNINTPPRFDGDVLTYVDLDIDVIVQRDYSYEVLDLNEFEANAARYGYSPEEKRNAAVALDELITKITAHHFPFQPLPAEATTQAF